MSIYLIKAIKEQLCHTPYPANEHALKYLPLQRKKLTLFLEH